MQINPWIYSVFYIDDLIILSFFNWTFTDFHHSTIRRHTVRTKEKWYFLRINITLVYNIISSTTSIKYCSGHSTSGTTWWTPGWTRSIVWWTFWQPSGTSHTIIWATRLHCRFTITAWSYSYNMFMSNKGRICCRVQSWSCCWSRRPRSCCWMVCWNMVRGFSDWHYCEIIINRGVLIFEDFVVLLSHQN